MKESCFIILHCLLAGHVNALISEYASVEGHLSPQNVVFGKVEYQAILLIMLK